MPFASDILVELKDWMCDCILLSMHLRKKVIGIDTPIVKPKLKTNSSKGWGTSIKARTCIISQKVKENFQRNRLQ